RLARSRRHGHADARGRDPRRRSSDARPTRRRRRANCRSPARASADGADEGVVMRAAAGPIHSRLLLVDPDSGAMRLGTLDEALTRGDVVVVNDAATLPASLRGRTIDGQPIELRLATPPEIGWGIVMGAGDWRTDTDLR